MQFNYLCVYEKPRLNIRTSAHTLRTLVSYNPGQKSLGHLGKTHAKGAYFILGYMYITKNFGIAVLTVFKVPPPPNNVENEGTDKTR